MRRTAMLVLVCLLAGCAPAASTSAPSTSPPATSPSAPASPGASASAIASAPIPSETAPASPSASPSAPASAAPSPEPTNALGRFECRLPQRLAPTTDRAQIVDVRVGRHESGTAGYDRIVFEFEGSGIPDFRLRSGAPPFTFDPSGLPMTVRGRSFLVIVMHGGTGITPDGEETYTGPLMFTPRFPRLRHLRQAGDFEAVSEWVVGMSGAACHRLFVLRGPTRIVLDLEHP
jgi:hypothetical protein